VVFAAQMQEAKRGIDRLQQPPEVCIPRTHDGEACIARGLRGRLSDGMNGQAPKV
jgi:hypothetical protein